MKEDKYPFISIIIPTRNRKKKLIRLINSILNSNYPKNKMEIIIVDDASTDGTSAYLLQTFKNFIENGKLKIIRNEKNVLLAASRNMAIEEATGDYILLIDDDNIIDKDCIKNLIDTFSLNERVGVVLPIMYYYRDKKRVWCAGVKRNMITSITRFIGRDEIDNGQFNKLINSEDFLNAFMIKKEVLEIVKLFDEKTFPIHYDEADLGKRIKNAGYKIICNPKSRVWHDICSPKMEKDKLRLFHVHNELRAYYTARNRIIFHKKYSEWWQFLIFIMIFNWLFTFYYLRILLGSKKSLKERLKIAKAYLKGVLEGLVWKKSY